MTNIKEIDYLKVDQLSFDPENPRLPQTLRDKKDTDDYENLVIDWMLQFENVTELMGSIGERGFFAAEPILVVDKENGNYEVVEGNRRLTAVKLLNDPSKASKKKKTIEEIISESNADVIPKEIPSIVFKDRSEVIEYLGYKHITGVQPWDSLAKAKYLKQLLQTLPKGDFYEQCKTLAKIIGSKANYVRLLLVGADVYQKIEENNYYDIPTLNEESFEFGTFYTALQRSNLSEYVGVNLYSNEPLKDLDSEKLKDLTKWMFEKNSEGFTRLGESRNLSKLDKVVNSSFPKALAAFKEGKSLDDAVRLTDHPLEIFQNSLNDSLYSLETSRNYIHEIEKPSEVQSETLKQIFKLSRDLYQLVQAKMLDDLGGDID